MVNTHRCVSRAGFRSVPSAFSAGSMEKYHEIHKIFFLMFRKGKASSRKGGFSADLLYGYKRKKHLKQIQACEQ